jgi:hypothetical protein
VSDNDNAMPTREDVQAMVIARAMQDPDYKQRLMDDPRGVLAEALMVSIPDFVEVTVHEDSLTDVHLVLPAPSVDALSDDDLELVAGGKCWDNWQQTTKLDGTTRWYLDFNGNGTWDMSEGRA